MTIHNMEIADKFNQLANLLEIEGANPFRIRAYRNAARIIGGLAKSVAILIAEGEDLTEIPGIGKDLAEKIIVLVNTGDLPLLKETQAHMPQILSELMKIDGLGPKRVQIIYKKLGIKNTDDLKTAIAQGQLRDLEGFGEKTEQKILQGIEHLAKHIARLKLADAFSVVDSLLAYVKKIKNIQQVECAGSFRRRKDTVGDLDILIAADSGEKIIKHFVKFPEAVEILSQGTTRAALRLHSGVQVDLRVVPEESYGAALIYFTGSKEHNIAIRKIAVQKNLKINEYGIYKGEKKLAGRTETDVYKQIDLPFIEPELREDRGEIEAARNHSLPKLITLADMRGDLNCHTRATTGNASIEDMAQAAVARGYEYLAIADHSKHLKIVHGLVKKAVLAQIKAIDKLNAKFKNFVILKSIEVAILEDGSLTLPDDVLKELDLTVCAIHSNFNLSQEEQTERIIRAMDNPYFNILSHLTGRWLNKRDSYPLDIERIIRAAKERGCILELNARPDRLDLNDIHCKMAKDMGVPIAISSASNSPEQLTNMQFGIYQARRGWLEQQDVINTRPLNELRKLLKR